MFCHSTPEIGLTLFHAAMFSTRRAAQVLWKFVPIIDFLWLLSEAGNLGHDELEVLGHLAFAKSERSIQGWHAPLSLWIPLREAAGFRAPVRGTDVGNGVGQSLLCPT
jgi:hypothetical protein